MPRATWMLVLILTGFSYLASSMIPAKAESSMIYPETPEVCLDKPDFVGVLGSGCEVNTEEEPELTCFLFFEILIDCPVCSYFDTLYYE